MRHGQDGQSLLLACVFLLVLSGAFVFLFDSGRLLIERVRLANAADQTAYAVATQEARLFNLNAYLNRAAIANQLAVAQELSIASWAEFTQPLPTRTAPLLAPPLTPFGAPINQASQMLATGMAAVPDAMGVLILQNQAANRLLAAHQRLLDTTYWPFLLRDTPDTVLRASGLDGEGVAARYVSTTQPPSRWLARNAGDDRQRLAPVLMASRDPFTRARHRIDESVTLGAGKCSVWTPNVPWFDLRKRGGTGLLGLDEWKAMDTFSLHAYTGYWKSRRFRLPKWVCSHSEYPLAFGSAAINTRNGDFDARSGSDFDGSWAVNESASGASRLYMPRFDVRQGGRALTPAVPEFYDLSPSTLGETAPVLPVVIRVSRSAAGLPLTSHASALKVGRTLEMYESSTRGELSALARAEVYFQRPPEAFLNQGKEEAPSLLNPYWRVRMADPVSADRLAPTVRIP